MGKNFEFTGETRINTFGVKLFQIRCTVAFGDVKVGDIGGWIEKEDNLSGNAWVPATQRCPATQIIAVSKALERIQDNDSISDGRQRNTDSVRLFLRHIGRVRGKSGADARRQQARQGLQGYYRSYKVAGCGGIAKTCKFYKNFQELTNYERPPRKRKARD